MQLTRRKTAQIAALVLIVTAVWLRSVDNDVPDAGREVDVRITTPRSNSIDYAFETRQSSVLVTGQGRVARLLADDRDGARHQRFVVELDSGLTVLIAHNIDIAPRVPELRLGQQIGFHGEYEWNDLGGVVHWTHHDPDGSHEGGWLEYAGRRYD